MRPRERLIVMLGEQLELLERSAAAFDEGHDSEALNLVTRIRTLCHDTRSSVSLLGQLGLTEGPTWYLDSCIPIEVIEFDKGNGVRTTRVNTMGTGLAGVEIGDGELRWFAPFDEDDRTLQSVQFERWWTEAKVLRDNKRLWTRKQLVLELANKEGGTHIDPRANDRYDRLGHTVARFFIETDDGRLTFGNNPVGATVRQVTWELLCTLNPHLDRLQVETSD